MNLFKNLFKKSVEPAPDESLSQVEKVRWYLERNYRLTVLDALHKGCGSELRSKISILKNRGLPIKSELVKGANYHVYYLDRAA